MPRLIETVKMDEPTWEQIIARDQSIERLYGNVKEYQTAWERERVRADNLQREVTRLQNHSGVNDEK